jgi:DnaJ-class molecular chaperone
MPKPKRGFLDGYKTYDPETEGYGSPDWWKDSFRQKMGQNEAKEVIGDDSPLGILGLAKGSTWSQIKSSFRNMALKWHPDLNKTDGAEAMMKKINAAFTVLEQQYSHK